MCAAESRNIIDDVHTMSVIWRSSIYKMITMNAKVVVGRHATF